MRDDEWVKLAGIAGERRLGDAGRDGFGWGWGRGIGRLLGRGRLVLGSPAGVVYLRIAGRGDGLRRGWGEAAVIFGGGRDEAFDG